MFREKLCKNKFFCNFFFLNTHKKWYGHWVIKAKAICARIFLAKIVSSLMSNMF